MEYAYEVSTYKTIEKESYLDGCLPETFIDVGVYLETFSDKSKLIAYLLDLPTFERNEDKLEYAVLEDDQGYPVTPGSILMTAYVKGTIDLYLASYSIMITRVIRHPMEEKDLSELLEQVKP
jgi:hypothetical protein